MKKKRFKGTLTAVHAKTLKPFKKRFCVMAFDRYDAMDRVGASIKNYDDLRLRSFVFGGPKIKMSRLVQQALAGAGPEEM
jgi:hypothetical protein